MLARRLAPQPLEPREPVLIAGDRLAIDQAGTHLEPVHGLDDERIAQSPIVPVSGDRLMARGGPFGIRLLTRNGDHSALCYPLLLGAADRLKERSCLTVGQRVER